MSKRAALVIANYQYDDEHLSQLVAPAQDAEALAHVLENPGIGGFEVQTLINEASYKTNRAIEAFFDNRKSDDLLLLYFSGHGVKDLEGRLYFATPDTDRRRLRTTAIPATLVNDVMRSSRSRKQVLFLDCCFSGAFAKGMVAKAEQAIGGAIGTSEQLGSRGRVVLTASDALQYAFEGDTVEGSGVCSLFSGSLVNGLETGEADLDGDGQITLDELYDYVYDHVIDETPQQRPEKWDFGVQGKIIIARNPNPIVKPAKLPDEVQNAIESPLAGVREGTIRELGTLLNSHDPGLVLSAKGALLRLVEDDSRRVSSKAKAQLAGLEAPQCHEEPEKITRLPSVERLEPDLLLSHEKEISADTTTEVFMETLRDRWRSVAMILIVIGMLLIFGITNDSLSSTPLDSKAIDYIYVFLYFGVGFLCGILGLKPRGEQRHPAETLLLASASIWFFLGLLILYNTIAPSSLFQNGWVFLLFLALLCLQSALAILEAAWFFVDSVRSKAA